MSKPLTSDAKNYIKGISFLGMCCMKQFSHVSKEHGFTSLVQITKCVMTISVGNLNPVDFCKPDIIGTIKSIDCSHTAGVLFNLEHQPHWQVKLEDENTFDLIVKHFNSNSMGMISDKLANMKGEVIGENKSSLHQQWNNGLSEHVLKMLIKNKGILGISDDEAIARVRKASPFFLSKQKHPMAEKFIKTEWPVVYDKARNMF